MLDYSQDQLKKILLNLEQPQFRAKQIREWLVKKYCSDFSKMLNLPLKLREQLSKDYEEYPLKIKTVQRSSDNNTIKFTAQTEDNEFIEVVLLKYSYGYSVCLSTQIGCAMGCAFCASTKGGLVRNCTSTDILSQLLLAEQIVKERVGRIVLMGMGEPLQNYQEVLKFLNICKDQHWGPGIGLRHVTISTCGIAPKIRELADEKLPVTLALSLHAPNDEIRKKIIPIAHKYSIKEIVSACRYYYEQTDRRVSCEYTLIKGINDSIACANKLVGLLKNEHMHINLIPYNTVDFLNWQAPTAKHVNEFANVLKRAKLTVTTRRRLGSDIDAACGQLRRRDQRVR